MKNQSEIVLDRTTGLRHIVFGGRVGAMGIGAKNRVQLSGRVQSKHLDCVILLFWFPIRTD